MRGHSTLGGINMYQEEIARPAFSRRVGVVLDRVESAYLRVLRAIILMIASVLLAYAGWLAVSSLYKISRSPDSVEEKVAAVAADEITNAEMPSTEKTASRDGKPVVNPAHQRFYADFVNRYYGLFRAKFEPYRQKEDKQLTRDEFDDSFLNTADRLNAVTKGELDIESDKADLGGLLAVMTQAADRPVTLERLQRYRSALKVPVSKQIQRTRTTYRSGWDRYSTACEGWYYEPMGCAVRREVQTPYNETVTTMEFPKGTQSHTQIFRAFQDRYLTLLEQRREENAAQAENERATIIADKEQGKSSLVTALQVVGGFLVLMFFFLLIAIERHQRRLAAERRATQEMIGTADMTAELA